MKSWLKGLFGTACAGVFVLAGVTGCSNAEQIKNSQEGIVYNGGSVVSVGDYLFYGNGFASGVNEFNTSSADEYNTAKEYSYLARINKKTYEGDKYKNTSDVSKISDRIAGYSNAYMFVCGDYIYYATPNMHKTNENKYVWTYVSIFRCKLDGSDNKEVFTTTAYNSATAKIRALSFNNNNYLVIYDGSNIVLLTLGGNVRSKVVSTNATSIALPKEDEEWNGNIFFTEDRNSTYNQKGNVVFKASVENGEKTKICEENDLVVTFTGRVCDDVFYTKTQNNISETYVYDSKDQQKTFATAGKWFYSLAISEVQAIAQNNAQYNGIVFSTTRSNATQIMYYNYFNAQNNSSYTAEVLVSSGFANTVVVYNDNFYYTTSDGIFVTNVLSKSTQTIVSDMSIRSGYFGYDFKYDDGKITRLNNIYFYATYVYDKDAEDYDEEKATDQNNYLYAVDASGVKEATLISKTI